jgi:CRP/FNR family cyclic AMP-dependent transcriptional regulator
MLRKNAKLELLGHVALFSECSKRELGEIATIADEIDFAAGETLIRQGDAGRQLFVMIEGAVEVVQNGETLPPRGGTEVFGEISLLSGIPATATVTTTTPGRALVIAAQHFGPLLDRYPPIQLRILRSLSERLAPHVI